MIVALYKSKKIFGFNVVTIKYLRLASKGYIFVIDKFYIFFWGLVGRSFNFIISESYDLFTYLSGISMLNLVQIYEKFVR